MIVNNYLGGDGYILSKIITALICNTVKVIYTCPYYILFSIISMISSNTYFMDMAGHRQKICIDFLCLIQYSYYKQYDNMSTYGQVNEWK